MTDGSLSTWRDGPARKAIIDFVAATCGEDGSAGVPVEERVAVFDNDGTLWCEKPMPIQLDFILRRLAEMVQAQPELRERQPWKAVAERDFAWFGSLMAEHYAGDDTNVQDAGGRHPGRLRGDQRGGLREQSDAFLRSAQHPTLGRGYLQCAYAPMVELLGYLDANGFSNYIVSGGGRDFMRPDQPGHVRHPPRAGHRQQQHLRLHQRRQRRHHHPQARGRLPRRRPGEARAHLEPHRPAPPARGRKLQRRRRQCSNSPTTPTSPRCASSSFTTTPSASSTTPPAPSRRSAEPRPTAGPSSASRTTGPRSSDLDPTSQPHAPRPATRPWPSAHGSSHQSVWRASHISDKGPIKVRPEMEDRQCERSVGNSLRSSSLTLFGLWSTRRVLSPMLANSRSRDRSSTVPIDNEVFTYRRPPVTGIDERTCSRVAAQPAPLPRSSLRWAT